MLKLAWTLKVVVVCSSSIKMWAFLPSHRRKVFVLENASQAIKTASQDATADPCFYLKSAGILKSITSVSFHLYDAWMLKLAWTLKVLFPLCLMVTNLKRPTDITCVEDTILLECWLLVGFQFTLHYLWSSLIMLMLIFCLQTDWNVLLQRTEPWTSWSSNKGVSYLHDTQWSNQVKLYYTG